MRSITRWRPQPTTGRATTTRVGALCRPVPRVRGISDAEWHALVELRPNLLLEGKLSATERVLRALRPYLAEPIFCWRATTPLTLPTDHRGSLLLFGVTGIGADEQARLFDWLSEKL